jgi:hypothetical protein
MPENEALRQLRKSGYAVFLQHIVCGVSDEGRPFVRAICKPELLGVLERRLREDCDHGSCDPWNFLHRDLGKDLCGWRSWNGTYGEGSMQMVWSRYTGRVHVDVDRWNTQDLVNVVPHLAVEVGWPRLKKAAKAVSAPFRKLRTLVRWLKTPESERE